MASKANRNLIGSGAGALLVVLVAALLLPCPTIAQQRMIQIGLSLAAACVAAGISGFVSVNLRLPVGTTVRAGGALAVFLIVFAFNPATWADASLDRRFSNATCEGALPVGLYTPRDRLPRELDPDRTQPITAPLAGGRPVRFSFEYRFDPYPGVRNWTQVRPGVWSETYPDPSIVTVFSERRRDVIDGCVGTVVWSRDKSGLEVFIPDKGCPLMWTRFRFADGTWGWIGEMKDVA